MDDLLIQAYIERIYAQGIDGPNEWLCSKHCIAINKVGRNMKEQI